MICVWLVVLLLVGVPEIAGMIAHVWFIHRRHVLDHAVSDDLPMTAGEWLAAQIHRRGLGERLRVVVTNHVTASKDAFHVQRGVIQLTEETSFKRDPVYWAIAAHELGHARFRLAHPWSLSLTIAANVAKAFLVRLGLGLAFGNLFFAISRATQLAHWLLGAALVLHALELVDELIASGSASRVLRADPGLGRAHIRAAHSTLIAAFLTYLLPFLAYVFLFSQWWLVERLTAVPRVASGGVTVLGLVGAALASAYVLLYAASHLMAAIRSPRLLEVESSLLSLAWIVSVCALILLGWDRHATVAHAWIVMLACSSACLVPVALISLPILIVLHPLIRWGRRYDRSIELSPAFRAARSAGAATTKSGNRWLEDMIGQKGTPPTLVRRIWELNKLAIIPLLIAFWL